MPNHSHLVPVPSTEAGLAEAIGEAHRRYTGAVNRRMGWTGHLRQGRFASYPLEDDYLRNVIRYVELNAVRAGLAEYPWDYPYCSAAARVPGRPDPLITLEPPRSDTRRQARHTRHMISGLCLQHEKTVVHGIVPIT